MYSFRKNPFQHPLEEHYRNYVSALAAMQTAWREEVIEFFSILNQVQNNSVDLMELYEIILDHLEIQDDAGISQNTVALLEILYPG